MVELSMVERLDFSHPSPTGAHIAGARVRVYRLPCRIHHQDQPEFMDHMARIFLEDLRTPIPTAVVRAEMRRRDHALAFVDKVIEIRREVS
jgi:hypothetical protein